MNSTNPLFFFLLFFLLLFFNNSLGLDPKYESCVPKECGDGHNISYPFYINGMQDPDCAYPGFKLQCNNSSPIMRISNIEFTIKNIQYDNHLIHLGSPNCPSVLNNLLLDTNRFVIVNDTTPITNMLFFSNCVDITSINSTQFEKYRIPSCEKMEYVMVEHDGKLKNLTDACGGGRKVIKIPVELDQSEVVDGGNYKEVVERGFKMRWLAAECGGCQQSGGRCGFNMKGFHVRCFCPDRPRTLSCKPDAGRKLPLLILVLALVAGVVAILIVIILCVRRMGWRTKSKNNVNMEMFLKNHEFISPKRYSYSQVRKMTNSFEVQLGQGGFGTVYKGVVSGGNLVAVKVLSEVKGDGEDFINEVASVGCTSHVNIVSLVGYCLEGHRKALIYEFMPNGSLERFIYGRGSSSVSQLGWEKLHQIAIGIARGLEYLHRGCNTRILHLDIKPHNILLDQDFCPKISDFGLAKLFPDERSKISMSHMRGTPGYIAPELISRNFGHVSHKSDVYSYGMLVLEMVGGRRTIEVEVERTSEIYFPHWIYKKVELQDEQLELPGIMSAEENEMVRKMIIVGLWCIQTNPLSRPTISKVLEMLEDNLASLEIPPKPYIFSPPRSVASSSTTR